MATNYINFRDNVFQLVFIQGWAVVLLSLSLVTGSMVCVAAEVNIYSGRKEALIRPVLDKFTEKTGIIVNLVSGKAGQLRERLLVEGRNSPADILITSDAANLYRAAEAGLLQPVVSNILDSQIPINYRDKAGRWFGLSLRARVLVYSVDRVSTDELSTYEDLASMNWHDRVSVRSSSNVYNQSLIASLIVAHGLEGAELWAKGLVENFARSPKGGDTDQIRAVAAGEADVAIVNSYYYGRLMASNDPNDLDIINKTALFFPNQENRGAHVNVSGAGLVAHARNRSEAILLLEFLAGPEGQRLFAELNHEFPVSVNVQNSGIVSKWGSFKADQLSLGLLGKYNGDAIRLADRAGWR